jgi:hypothetical protein
MRQRDLKPDLYWGRVHKLPKEFTVFSLSKGNRLLLRVYKDGLTVVVRGGSLKHLFRRAYNLTNDAFRVHDHAERLIHELLGTALIYDAYGKEYAKKMGETFGDYGRRDGGAAKWRFTPSQLFARVIEVQRWWNGLMSLMDVSNMPEPAPVQTVYYYP